ncbi:MAG TPA: DUF6249 domain-containing protein [Atribacteraceae bacterium]|nr:DUF6249 domain-containing protein [Atribacteraceae bacterium]
MIIDWIWVLIPLAGIMVAIVAIYTEHLQKLAMIEKGLNPDELKRTSRPEDMLRGGIIVAGIGLAFLITQLAGRMTNWLYLPGFILLFIGLALVLLYYLPEKKKEEKT